jgi:Tfp pilus assembly protein PilO
MKALKSDRFWMLGGVLAGIVVVALAWFLAVGPELSNASSLESQTTDAQNQNASLQVNIRKLQQQNADMTALTTALLQARTALPVDTDIAAYTRQLSAYAASNHVQLTGISTSGPVSATAKPGQPAAAPTGSAAGQLFALPLTVIIKGSIADDLKYLHAVQNDQRSALVTSTQLANDASKTGKLTQLTIQLQVYVAPQTPEVAAALQKQLAAATTTK